MGSGTQCTSYGAGPHEGLSPQETPQFEIRTSPNYPSVPSFQSPYDEFYEEPPILSGEGYLPAILRGATRRKLDPSHRRTNLEMAPISTNIINLELAVQDHPELSEVLGPIMDPNLFESLFQKEDDEPRKRAPLSRGMAHYHDTMTTFDIVEPFHATAMMVAACALLWCTLFMVAKKNGLGRLVIDARPVNRRMPPPGPMGLPRLHDTIRHILSFSWAAKSDGRSYFYQFPLHEKIRPYFKARLAEWRGTIHTVQLKRMPMGWSYSPRIAQHFSNMLVQGLGLAWVDDFIVGGLTKDDFEANRDQFISRTNRYNVAMDDVTMFPSTTLKAIGMEFDLIKKLYRLDPAWVERRKTDWAKPPETYREWFVLYGGLIWADHAMARPLWNRAEALAALRTLATACRQDFDAPATLPQYARTNINEWIQDVSRNEWSEAPPTKPDAFDYFLFSDASSDAAAWILIHQNRIIQGDAWTRERDEHIFLGELKAFVDGILRSNAPLPSTLGVLDNTAVNACARKGHSSSYAANVILRDAFGPRRPWTTWLPTHLQLADPYTRGILLPPLPTQLTPTQQVVLQRLRESEPEAKLHFTPTDCSSIRVIATPVELTEKE